MYLKIGLKALLLTLFIWMSGFDTPYAGDREAMREKQIELSELEQGLKRMRRSLEQFSHLQQRALVHQSERCGQPYQAAASALQIIRARREIAGYDKERAEAKITYRAKRLEMMQCISASVRDDPSLWKYNVVDYETLASVYDDRRASAQAIYRRYEASRKHAQTLAADIKALAYGLPELDEENNTALDCGPHGTPVWRGNTQSCECSTGYVTPAQIGLSADLVPVGCIKRPEIDVSDIPIGDIPESAEENTRDLDGGVFGQPDPSDEQRP